MIYRIKINLVNSFIILTLGLAENFILISNVSSDDSRIYEKEISDFSKVEEIKKEIIRRQEIGLPINSGKTKSACLEMGNLISCVSDYDLYRMGAEIGGQKPIYGTDDRKDWKEITEEDKGVRDLIKSTAAIFKSEDIIQKSDDLFNLKTISYNKQPGTNLCSGEKYESQNTGSYCSGTLVGKDLILTAAHCLKDHNSLHPPIEEMRFVFGFWVTDQEPNGKSSLYKNQIYSGSAIAASRRRALTNEDWALIRLDRSVDESIAKPISRIFHDKIENEAKVFVIGYPAGLPVKYAPNAQVTYNEESDFFVANLDTFGGNSGSGVYRQDSNELVGILVRGEPDYIDNPNMQNKCKIVNHCPKPSCDGEIITRISKVRFPKNL